MGPDEKPVEPPPENLRDRMITWGTWVVAVLALAVVIFLAVFLIRVGLGHEDTIRGAIGGLGVGV